MFSSSLFFFINLSIFSAYSKELSSTKESLGRSEEVIGTIKITSVTPKQAYGNIVSTTKENLEALFKPKMMLVRPFTDDMNKEAQKEKIKKKRAEQKKKFDDDW